MKNLYVGIGVFVGIFVVVIQHAFKVIQTKGHHVTVFNHAPGPCRLIPGVDEGSEDMETLPDGRTFITSGFTWSINSDKSKKFYKDHKRRGRVLFFDFKQPEKGVTELGIDATFDQSTFYPHGISVLQNETSGRITLFVVNHYPDFDKIEKFEFIEDQMMLQHQMSYADEAVRLVNDVAATSEGSFYFTNYAYSRSHFWFQLEMLFLLPYGNVVHYDGTGYEVVAEGMVIPNGITLSKDHRNVYVACGAFKTVNIYQRDDNGQLTMLHEYPLNSGPDNILIEPLSGNLVIAGHPVRHRVGAYSDNPTLPSPSKVHMINMVDGGQPEGITELYSNDGSSLLSASTVASIYGDKMLVGSIMSHLMYCELTYRPWED